MEDVLTVFFNGLYSSINLVFKLIIIIVPLTISYEFLKLRKKPYTEKEWQLLGISKEGLLPFLTGIIIGLTYGAGIIVHSIRRSSLSKNEALLVLLFLSICHAIIEDTLIFVVIGANGVILIVARLFLAILITMIVARVLRRSYPLR